MEGVQDLAQKIRDSASLLQNCRVGPVALCLIISFLLVACGGGSRRPSSDPSPTTQDALPATSRPSDPSPSAQNALPATSTPSDPSPSTQNVRPGTEEFGLSKEGLVKSIEAVEALIAECMNDAGFEYIAVDYNTVRKGMVADKSLPGLSERGYINQYGFGISTLYSGLPPQLAEATTPAKIGLGERNVEKFKNLSPADQVAYNRTLFGENTDATFAVAIETEDFSRTGGCTRAAIEQVFTPEQLNTTYLNPKDALIEQDPRMVAALAKFSDCLRAEGFDYTYEREVEPDLKKRLYAITGGAPVESLSADARAALTELQGFERALAVVVYECESRILDPVEDQVERELFAGRQG